MMLVLRVLKTQPLRGYAIAQRIHQLSAEERRTAAARRRDGGVPADGERDWLVAG
jgi:hypothetical protein